MIRDLRYLLARCLFDWAARPPRRRLFSTEQTPTVGQE